MPTTPDSRFCLSVSNNAGNLRRLFWGQHFSHFSATIERGGGYADGSVVCTAEFTQLATFALGDCVEAWFDGIRRYRGYVEDVERGHSDPPTLTLTLNGISFRAGQLEAAGQYLRPSPVDVATLWADVAADAVLPAFPSLTLSAQPVGATAQQIDGTYKQFGEVSTSLINGSAENRAVWGGDVDVAGNDRLFIRPFSNTVDFTIPVPGQRTGAARTRLSTGLVANRLRLLGGPAYYPNYLYNASLERLRFIDAAANLLRNPSLEDGAEDGRDRCDHWNLTAGASMKSVTVYTGLLAYLVTVGTIAAPEEQSSHTGEFWCELDHVGEACSQSINNGDVIDGSTETVLLAPGDTYAASVWCRQKGLAGGGTGALTLTWLDSTGAALSTASADVVPASTAYAHYEVSAACPMGATGVKVQAACTGLGGGNGLDFDDFALVDASRTVADRWALTAADAARITAQNWAARGAWDGLYCLQAEVTATDTDGEDVRLTQDGPAGAKIATTPGQTFVFSCYAQSVPGKSQCRLFLELAFFDAQGVPLNPDATPPTMVGGTTLPGILGTPARVSSTATLLSWTRLSITATAPAGAASASVAVGMRSAGAVRLDAFSLRDHSAPAGEFIRDGNYTAIYDVSDSRLASLLETGVAASQALYGVRYAQVQADLVTTGADALSFAAAYFNTHALPHADPPVEVYDDPRAFLPGLNVELTGELGPALMGTDTRLPIVRVRLTYDGIWRQSLELRQEVPDLADALLVRLRRQGGPLAAGSQTGTGAGTSSGIIGGGSSAKASSTVSGTLKTTADHADPIVYEKTETDSTFATQAALTTETAARTGADTAEASARTAADATKEPGLGIPATDGFVLASTTGGARSWVAPTGAPGGGVSLVSALPTASVALRGKLYLVTSAPDLLYVCREIDSTHVGFAPITLGADVGSAFFGSASPVSFADTDSRFVYGSGWTAVSDGSAPFGTKHFNGTAGGAATLNFTGTRATLTGFSGGTPPQLSVSIDGGSATTVTEGTGSSTWQTIYDTGVLASGSHTLALTLVSGTTQIAGGTLTP